MKTEPINITPAEWDIMEVLWQQAPLSAAEIYEILQTQTDWTVKTVRSFLDRLVQKKAVRKDKIHGMNVFRPIPKRSQCLRQESESFLKRFFQGNAVSLVRHFVEQESLSDQDIARLQELLRKKKE
ncbi:MAG: BlaI/MecI/CopY family transcriptional regulator [Phycisphaerales bacterium]|nr:MAG: BlaI/MecI/CopY family transcriptional regulator [Phycisphaerales bacterium]